MTTSQHPDQKPKIGSVTIEELIRRHGARPIASVDDLAGAEDPFEFDEEHEELFVGPPDKLGDQLLVDRVQRSDLSDAGRWQ